ncbi:MAG: cytochrome c oxidase subunit II [Deltaproteobacteria bacterium HGW-Deltaproteobacteria-8]|jgi:cytochrome c oxidase subunit 2|nr:MAG: cytochrome c oxidase subunit II [Deltaproteobacteria bacterium HGW-Deltaproteobacteria-8]
MSAPELAAQQAVTSVGQAVATAHPGNLVNVVAAVDNTFLLIFGISAALLVLITAAMIYFVIRYSRKNNPVPADFSGNLWAEVIWIVLPTLLVLGMFWSGWHSYRALRDAPAEALEIKVQARMWSWDFEYPDGRHSGTLVVPVGKPVKLSLTSKDVIHGFFAPAFRLKIDTVPGMTSHAWFRADKEGEYVIFCSVYCGLQHAKMLSAIKAVSQAEFERFLAEKPASAGNPGKALMDAKGCLGCHSLDGTESVGPSLKGVYGKTGVFVVPGGKDKGEKRLKLDEAGLKQVIMEQRVWRVKGFEPVMPGYADQMSPDELAQIIDFLKSGEAPGAVGGVTVPTATPEQGRALAEAQGCLGCHSTDGSEIVGPSFKGLFGSASTAKDKAPVDRGFVQALLKDPATRLGRPSSMPAYPDLTDAERQQLLLFLESLAAVPGMEHKAGEMAGHEAATGAHK